MQMLLRSFSKTVIAFVAMGFGIIAIIAANPPHTICDTQEQVFRQSQAGNIFPPLNRKMGSTPMLFKEVDTCKSTNSAGGCYGAFSRMERLLADFKHVPTECYGQISEIPQVKSVLHGGMSLMANLAWGDKPPGEGLARYGFLASSDLHLFCNLKQHALNFYGEQAFSAYRLSVFAKYPGADKMHPDEVWNRSIFSTRCDAFL